MIGADAAPRGRNVTTPLIICSVEASLDELIVLVSAYNECSLTTLTCIDPDERNEATEMQSLPVNC